MKKLFLSFTVLMMAFSSCKKDNTAPCTNDKIENCAEYSFQDDVSPIITTWCCTCHWIGNDSGIELCDTAANYDGVKKNSCLIINAINHKDGVPAMPLPGAPSNKLTDQQIETITCWSQGGMKNN